MKAFRNINPRDLRQASALAQQTRRDGHRAVFAGGGSDVLGMMKDRLIAPDVVVNLKALRGLDQIATESGGAGEGAVTIGGLATLDAISRDETIRRRFFVLAEAAASVATPQIRNVATVAGNLCQRPWCWYYRNGFKCFKNGGSTCFSAAGENQFHAIFGGGPSYIVHPSDTATALVALDARFRIVGARGERIVPAAEFFTLPKDNAARENVLEDDEVLAAVMLPAAIGTRSRYHKVMDREAWTHAVVSAAVVLEMDNEMCRSARVVLGGVAPIPWRLPEVERMLAGNRITEELAARCGEAAVSGARPLAKNGYKIPLTRAMVKRAVISVSPDSALL
jgi:xanthine dehydrogenase YagS FAD-binding subunit